MGKKLEKLKNYGSIKNVIITIVFGRIKFLMNTHYTHNNITKYIQDESSGLGTF